MSIIGKIMGIAEKIMLNFTIIMASPLKEIIHSLSSHSLVKYILNCGLNVTSTDTSSYDNQDCYFETNSEYTKSWLS